MRHELKIWPSYYYPILTGLKTFEVRVNDRDFKVSDVLWLQEYIPSSRAYTGRSLHVKVTYLTIALGLLPHGSNLVIMSIIPCSSDGV